jgi:hypothetical protein
MLDSNPFNQVSTSSLVKKLESIETQIVSRKDIESMVGLGLSMVGQVKASQVMETSGMNTNHLLKVSGINFDQIDKASTVFPLEAVSDASSKQI